MGMAAADAGEHGGGEHIVPALPPLNADRTEAPPPNPPSPWRPKSASMAVVVPVEGDEHGGREDLLPALPPLLSERTEAPPNPLSPWRRKSVTMVALDGGEHCGGQDTTATTTPVPNQLSPCNGSKQFEIDWRYYLDQDAQMLTLGGTECVVATGPLLPLLAQAIESASQVASSNQPNDVDAERLTNDVDADHQPNYDLVDPFDNEEEYVGVDDENMYDVTVPITITVTEPPKDPTIIEEDSMDEAEVMHHIQEEYEVADSDPLQYNIAHDPENPDIRVGALFPDIEAFRKAIRHHAVMADFEFAKVRTDQRRFIAECAYETCPWRIHASRLRDEPVIMIKNIPFEHDCPTTKLEDSKMASQDWVAE